MTGRLSKACRGNATVSTVSGQAGAAASVPGPSDPTLFQPILNHRSDYLYILPALAVMLVVIAYPIWYTIEL